MVTSFDMGNNVNEQNHKFSLNGLLTIKMTVEIARIHKTKMLSHFWQFKFILVQTFRGTKLSQLHHLFSICRKKVCSSGL